MEQTTGTFCPGRTHDAAHHRLLADGRLKSISRQIEWMCDRCSTGRCQTTQVEWVLERRGWLGRRSGCCHDPVRLEDLARATKGDRVQRDLLVQVIYGKTRGTEREREE